jgi:hypothetical protein
MRSFLLLFILICIQNLNGQSKKLEPFTAIRVAAGVKVELYPSDTHKADYTIHKGSEEDLVIEVNNDILTVKIQSKKGKYNRNNTSATVKVYAKEIRSVDCSSGSSLRSDNVWKSPEMRIEVSSGANCRIGIDTENARAESSSGASLTLYGNAGEISMEASSGAKIDGLSLTARSVNADVSSGAGISIHVTESIKADASSGGTIKYKGNPDKKNIHTGMSGVVKSI